MRVVFGVWGRDDEGEDSTAVDLSLGEPPNEKVEYVAARVNASAQSSDLETLLVRARKFLGSFGPNDVAVFFDPDRAELESDPMSIVATLYRTKCHAMLASSRRPSRKVSDDVNEGLPKLPTSRAVARYPDAEAVVVGYVGALRAVLSDKALLRREELSAEAPGAWERFWTMAFLKSGSPRKGRPYPRIALDYFEELGSAANESDDDGARSCFRVLPRRDVPWKTVGWVAGVFGFGLVLLVVLFVVLSRRKSFASQPLPDANGVPTV